MPRFEVNFEAATCIVVEAETEEEAEEKAIELVEHDTAYWDVAFTNEKKAEE